jgi:hypothetical protein
LICSKLMALKTATGRVCRRGPASTTAKIRLGQVFSGPQRLFQDEADRLSKRVVGRKILRLVIVKVHGARISLPISVHIKPSLHPCELPDFCEPHPAHAALAASLLNLGRIWGGAR